MHRVSRSTICWVILPAAAVAFYFGAWWLLPSFFLRSVASESGLVELGTAVLFLAASFVAARLAAGGALPAPYRWLYGLFAVAALFVALEEISYGQHLFGWSSPEYFREHNLQGEVNLHNMLGSKPSKRMHMIADLGTAVGFVVLPGLLWLVRRYAPAAPDPLRRASAYVPGTWTHYLLPGIELIAIVLLARLVGWLKKIPGAGVDHNELRELLWSWAAFGYVVLMRRRLLGLSSVVPRPSTVGNER
jgi:hypothetical protein